MGIQRRENQQELEERKNDPTGDVSTAADADTATATATSIGTAANSRFVEFGVGEIEKSANMTRRISRQYDAWNGQLRQASHHMDATARFFREVVQQKGYDGHDARSDGDCLSIPVPPPPIAQQKEQQQHWQKKKHQETETGKGEEEDEENNEPWSDDRRQHRKEIVQQKVKRYMLGDHLESLNSPTRRENSSLPPSNARLTIMPVHGQVMPRITLETGDNIQSCNNNSNSSIGFESSSNGPHPPPPTEAELDDALRRIADEKTTVQKQRAHTSTEVKRLVDRGLTMLLSTVREEEEEEEEQEEQDEHQEEKQCEEEEEEGEKGKKEKEDENKKRKKEESNASSTVGNHANNDKHDDPDELEPDMPLFFEPLEDYDFNNTSFLEELLGDDYGGNTDLASASNNNSSSSDDDFAFFLDSAGETDDDEEEYGNNDDEEEEEKEGEDNRKRHHGSASSVLHSLDKALGRDRLPSQSEAAHSIRLHQTTQRLSQRMRQLETHLFEQQKQDDQKKEKDEVSAESNVLEEHKDPKEHNNHNSSQHASIEVLQELTGLYDILDELIKAIDYDAVDRKTHAEQSSGLMYAMLKRMSRAFAREKKKARRYRKNPAIRRIYEALRTIDEKHRTLAQRLAERLSAQNSHIYRYNKEQTKALRRDLADQAAQLEQLTGQVATMQRRAEQREKRFTGCLTTLFDVVGVLATSLDETRAEMGLFRDAYLQQQQFYHQLQIFRQNP